MGSSWSSTFSSGNAETKTILNTILKRLISQVDLRDMYSLADPKMCKEYIVIATGALEKLFAKIRIDRSKDGTISFQSIKGIRDANPNPWEQQQRCKELAFFFIRIFQIYAAITLSIMDSELPVSDPNEIVQSIREPYQRRGALIRANTGLQGFPIRGGAIPIGDFYLTDDAGAYKILNNFLDVPNGDQALQFSKNHGITISQDSLYTYPKKAFDAQLATAVAAETAADPAIAAAATAEVARLRALPPAPTRKVKDNIKPRLFYTLRGALLEADLTCTEESDKIKVELYNFKVGDKKLDERFQRTLVYRADRVNPTTSDGKDLPTSIHNMFEEALNRVNPEEFSAGDFLLKHRLIYEGGRIMNTNITITNYRDKTGSVLRAIYNTNFKLDERARQVKIMANIIIEKGGNTTMKGKEYTIKIDFDSIETEPRELKQYLDIDTYKDTDTGRFHGRYKKFYTGQSGESSPRNDKQGTIPEFLERSFKKLLLERDELQTRDSIKFTREGFPKPLDSSEIPPEMRILKIWEQLAKDPPVKAHCMARAMQLLNVAAIRGESSEAYSSICRVKFPYAKDGSLPPAGQPITEEYGILSLAMLFVDKLVAGSPQITADAKFTEFRKRFKFFFERVEQNEGQVEAPEKFNQIDEKLMPMCKGHTRDRIRVEGSTLYALKDKANQLINRQSTHVRNCMSILFKVFDEKTVRSGGFAISNYVQQDGMEALNKIAEETRNMLIDYYGDCEKTYKDGLFILYKKHVADKDATKYQQVD